MCWLISGRSGQDVLYHVEPLIGRCRNEIRVSQETLDGPTFPLYETWYTFDSSTHRSLPVPGAGPMASTMIRGMRVMRTEIMRETVVLSTLNAATIVSRS